MIIRGPKLVVDKQLNYYSPYYNFIQNHVTIHMSGKANEPNLIKKFNYLMLM